MKVVVLRAEVIEVDEVNISVGMLTVLPSWGGMEGLDGNEGQETLDGTIPYEGQLLKRKEYQELQREFQTAGTFYDFQVPNLRRKVIMDFTPDGEPIMGDVLGYAESFPKL